MFTLFEEIFRQLDRFDLISCVCSQCVSFSLSELVECGFSLREDVEAETAGCLIIDVPQIEGRVEHDLVDNDPIK